jgi:hypothetical protein
MGEESVTLDPSWERRVRKKLRELREQGSLKARRSDMVRIALKQKFQAPSLPMPEFDPEDVCMDCICSDNLDLAFAVFVRHLEKVGRKKAERADVTEKTTQRYVQSLFDRLGVMYRDQIEESAGVLEQALLEKVELLNSTFQGVRNNIEKKVATMEREIEGLHWEMASFRWPDESLRTTTTNRRAPVKPSARDRARTSNLSRRRDVLRSSFERRRIPRPIPVSKAAHELRETLTVTSDFSPK